MEQRRKSSPARQSESVESWRKKGGGPWALVTPAPAESDLASSAADAAAMRLRKIDREVVLILIQFTAFPNTLTELYCRCNNNMMMPATLMIEGRR